MPVEILESKVAAQQHLELGVGAAHRAERITHLHPLRVEVRQHQRQVLVGVVGSREVDHPRPARLQDRDQLVRRPIALGGRAEVHVDCTLVGRAQA